MAKDYKCPACSDPVDGGAVVCSNPACKRELAFCSHCRDLTTLDPPVTPAGRFGRDRYRCGRCERIGVKCWTWSAGGYCNGLARAGGRLSLPLCARCNDRFYEVGRNALGLGLGGILGGMIKPRK